MPFVTIRLVEGQSQERKDELARRISAAVHEVTGVSRSAVWVVYEDVPAGQWYVGGDSLAALRAAKANEEAARQEAGKGQAAGT